VRITTLGISLSLAVMIISVAVVTGFKNTITNKVIGFGGHIQIEYYDSNSSYETNPISANQKFLPELKALPGFNHIQVFGIKAGIMKSQDEIQGVVLKGVSKDFDWSFYEKNLVEGQLFSVSDSTISNKILISRTLANLLKLKCGNDVAMYFIQEPARMRRFTVSGIYETGLEELDSKFVLGDIRHVRKLNNWDSAQISGFEVNIKDIDQLDQMTNEVERIASLNLQPDGSALRTTSIKEKYPQLFDWLSLVNMNVWVIMLLMLVVAGFNMISGLMILILERTNMIGLLSSLGARSISIRKIFIYQSGFMALKGLFWGNLAGIGVCFIQYQFHLVKLNQETYFLSSVPINFNILYFVLLNIGTLVAVLLMLVIPSMVISKISPDTTLRYN
jgi:lipoprotein-releasing system permease protein